jgi:F0F1-type ATP synthase assembly protein I
MKNVYLKYSTMAFQMGTVIGLFAFGGYELDKHFNTSHPYFTIALSLTGVGISLFSVIRDFIKPDK